jgi:hypothetical protein
MVEEEKGAPEQEPETITCDVCGRPVPAEAIWWEEDSGLMCCRECRAEKESCGCSD